MCAEYDTVSEIIRDSIDWDKFDELVPEDFRRNFERGIVGPVELAIRFPGCVSEKASRLAAAVA